MMKEAPKFIKWNFALALATGSIRSLGFSGVNLDRIFSLPPINFDELLPKEFMRSDIRKK